MSICPCCGDWHHLDPEEYPHPFGFDDKSQAFDNVRWLAEQLSRSAGFDHLGITVEWDVGDSLEVDPPDIEDSQSLLKPFKAVRNVKELKIGGLGTIMEMMMDCGEIEDEMLESWQEVIAYKKKLRAILGSNAPVNENPIPLSTWLHFKQIVRRLMGFAPQVGAQKFLGQAAHAVRAQDKKAFQKASNGLFHEWKEEQKQRKKIATQFSELRQTTFLDIPAGQRKEDDPKGLDYYFSWSDPSIDKDDRAAYISFLESID
ncbi:hypothetical protein UCDDS831_g05493 [Diplodia seriata]|uniref:Uncharacterized protein n=1 Tax=Diplodia seriata TaxID=420778 RepID=A0A0G2G6B1_9PEZI|nr:hypothetical protein UCDDS831_g05493 [Diplodia seriata]